MSIQSEGTNRLSLEKSPYLLQHANNPVDWFPWSEEAFEKARSEDKPIFLSIGYSTCHWCHVMERESFEDDEVAELLNEGFVSIKVDREERPDIDAVYMTVCQMMTGSGGWPLSIVMTPDKKPFFAATYIPKGSRIARVGLMELLPRIQEIWKSRRSEVLQNGDRVAQVLASTGQSQGAVALGTDILEGAYQNLSKRHDAEKGGFGRAPKFPTPHTLTFLLRDWKRRGRAESLEMVENTLQAMGRGGIYDHIGFGFHRYSTDRDWLVPHFEKMLYDQALLIIAHIEAYQVTQKEEYAETAREIIEYVLRDMKASDGGFNSAEDADSEGEEGKFYIWTTGEVLSLLGHEDGDRLISVFNFTKEGNFTDEATKQRTGQNIAHLQSSPAEIAQHLDMSVGAFESWLSKTRQKLLEYRSKRVRPLLDDKVLTDWNGLMIAALARASSALDEPRYLQAAKGAADFILSQMTSSDDGSLLHRFRDGEAALPAFLDDYAFFSWGLLDLYEASFETRYFTEAQRLTEVLLERFWDQEEGGFFLTSDRTEKVLTRHKDAYDGATPSGNSVAAVNLIRLARMTGNMSYEEHAEKTLTAFSALVARAPEGFTHLLQALDLILGKSLEVVITGPEGREDTRKLLSKVRSTFLPQSIVLFRPDGGDLQELDRLSSFTINMVPLEGKATAYVCSGHACDLPTTDVDQMLERIGP